MVSFIYQFRVGRWALMAAPSERTPETPRGGKIETFRIGAGILRIPG